MHVRAEECARKSKGALFTSVEDFERLTFRGWSSCDGGIER
jgi:hypothetical protein